MRIAYLAVLLIACSQDPKREPPVPEKQSAVPADAAPDKRATPDVSKLCVVFAEALCRSYERCLGDWFVLKHGDFASCKATEQAACSALWALPGSQVSDATMATCLDALANKSCPFFGHNIPECALPPGALTAGERCVGDVQCAGGFCRRDPAQAPWKMCGTCTRMPREGDRCPDFRCANGTSCSDGSCKRHRGIAGACEADRDCEMNLRCEAGACKPARIKGDPCAKDAQCAGDLVCVKKRCAAPPQVGVGKPCPDDLLTFGDLTCEPGLKCKSGKKPTCQRLLAVGDKCDLDSQFLCPYWTRCYEGTCTIASMSQCTK